MKGIAILGVVLALGAACSGSDDGGSATTTVDDPAAEDADNQAVRYTTDYEVCELIGKSARGELDFEFEDDTGITIDPAADPTGYAQAYAERYGPEFQQSGFEGCLDGLLGNPPKEPLP